MLMIIFMHYVANLMCRKAPLFALGQTLSRCHQRFVSEHVVGQVSQSDFGSCPNYADSSQNQIPGHHRLSAENMFNPTARPRPCMVATLFSFCQFFMTASFSLKTFSESSLRKRFQFFFVEIEGAEIEGT